jgi:hypothetical protein
MSFHESSSEDEEQSPHDGHNFGRSDSAEDEIESRKHKYEHYLSRGKSISYLRSLKEEKVERLERIKEDIRIIREIKGYDGEEEAKKLDSMERKRYKIEEDIIAIGEVILGIDKEENLSKKENGEKILSDNYNPFAHTPVSEVVEYINYSDKVRSLISIQRFLDKHHEGWVSGNIPSSSKRKIEEYLGYLSSDTVQKYIDEVRLKKRKDKIKSYLNKKFPEWTDKPLPPEERESLASLLSIPEDKIESIIQDIRGAPS